MQFTKCYICTGFMYEFFAQYELILVETNFIEVNTLQRRTIRSKIDLLTKFGLIIVLANCMYGFFVQKNTIKLKLSEKRKG